MDQDPAGEAAEQEEPVRSGAGLAGRLTSEVAGGHYGVTVPRHRLELAP